MLPLLVSNISIICYSYLTYLELKHTKSPGTRDIPSSKMPHLEILQWNTIRGIKYAKYLIFYMSVSTISTICHS